MISLRISSLLLAIAASLFFIISPCAAQSMSEQEKQEKMDNFQAEMMQRFVDELHLSEEKMLAAEAVLKSKPAGQWSDEEQESYLQWAMFTIYDGFLIYKDIHRQLPQGSNVLMRMDIISHWPGNPYNNWEPIRWEGEGFRPGNIVVQECPPELYSGLWNPKPMTFIMSINGPSADYVPLQEITYPLEYWAVRPAGSVWLTGATSSPHSEAYRQYKEQQRFKAEQARNAQDSSQEDPETEQG
ncbi:MAG: hypothetical protein H7A35_11405 [Planctomycetales bacterium]|nr:hypothetical protein [bacterium]UNM07467.1 MAG: hypothetical protein H7A35_11405 [Planctomycetales bacterium]